MTNRQNTTVGYHGTKEIVFKSWRVVDEQHKGKVTGRQTRKNRPLVVLEDELNISYRPDNDLSYEDGSVDEEVKVQSGSETCADDSFCTTQIDNPSDTLSAISTLTFMDDLIESFEGQLSTDVATAGKESERDDNEWVDIFSTTSSFTLLDSPNEPDITIENWEVLSEASPAVLLEKKSYAEIAKSGWSTPMPTIQESTTRNSRMEHPVVPKSDEEVEDPTGFSFDSEFVKEGIKGSRGGKKSLRFKGNQKTTKRPKRRPRKRTG